MSVIEQVGVMKNHLQTEVNFVTARGEAKGMKVSDYVTLANIHEGMLGLVQHTYKFDHRKGEQDFVSSAVAIFDEIFSIKQFAQTLIGGAYDRLAKIIVLRAEKVISSYVQFAGSTIAKRRRLMEKTIPKEVISLGKMRNTISAALQREKLTILEN